MHITLLQSNTETVNEVYYLFENLLPKYYNNMDINNSEKNYILNKRRQRFNLIYGYAHGVAYLLDPRYLGEDMDITLKESVENLIFSFGSNEDNNVEIMEKSFIEYNDFMFKNKEDNLFRYKIQV